MAQDRLQDMTDDELIDPRWGGLDVAVAIEMTRRLKDQTASSQRTMTWLTRWIAALTVVLVIFGAVQLSFVLARVYAG